MTQPEHDMGPKIVERIGGARVGDLLRRRRAELGQDIGAVAKALRIRQRYLEAIEEGRLGDLPGPTYVLGFVRSYAEHLGFDSGKIISEFRQEVGVAGPQQPIRWKSQSGASSSGKSAFVIVVLLLSALAAGWYFFGQQVAPPSLVESLPEILRPRAAIQPTEPAPTPAEESNAQSDSGAQTTASDGSVGEAENGGESLSADGQPVTADVSGADGDSAASNGESVAVAAQPSTAEADAPAGALIDDVSASVPPSDGETEAATSLSDSAGASESAVAAPPAGPKVIIRARLESWVEILNSKQEIIVSRVFRAGETFALPDEPGLVLNTGNAGGLDVEVDGRVAPSLGSIGLVRRGIVLDPALLVSGQATSPSPSQSTSEPSTLATDPDQPVVGD